MAAVLEAIINCLTGAQLETDTATRYDEKTALPAPHEPHTAEEVAHRIVETIIEADKCGADLKRTLDDVVGEYGWTEKVAEWVLFKLEQALRSAEKLRGPLREAYDKACGAAVAVEGFVQEHPVFCTVIALGVLVVIAPWVLGVLGFAELGPIEGTSAYYTILPRHAFVSGNCD